jgi:hypothetical protein
MTPVWQTLGFKIQLAVHQRFNPRQFSLDINSGLMPPTRQKVLSVWVVSLAEVQATILQNLNQYLYLVGAEIAFLTCLKNVA